MCHCSTTHRCPFARLSGYAHELCLRDYAFFMDMVEHRQSMAKIGSSCGTVVLVHRFTDLKDCAMMPYFYLSSVMGLTITL